MAPRLYSLTDATQLISPEGRITARSLRTEARAGRLQPVRIAGKDFVTEESLAAMVAAATLQLRPPCPVADFQPAPRHREAAIKLWALLQPQGEEKEGEKKLGF